MKVLIFVPGYLTAPTCSSRGDTYLAIYKHACKYGFEFIYTPIPNNNYGDLGNITLNECVANVVAQYNDICETRNIGPTDTLVLFGHSMGGLIVSKMVTSTLLHKLKRRPDAVRLINPAITINLSWANSVLGTLSTLLPNSILSLPVLPIPVAERDWLFKGSSPYAPGVKPLLLSTMLQAQGGLLMNNRTWCLSPDDALREHITIVQCSEDKVVSSEGARMHADAHNIHFVAISGGWHQYFDRSVLTALFRTLVPA